MDIIKVSDILEHQSECFPLDQSISGKRKDNISYTYSTEELRSSVNRFSTGLLKRGFKKGDKISLISYNNRPEWNIADLGMLQIGVINVSVYPNISPEDYVYIFNKAKVKYCIAGYGDILNKILQAQTHIPSLERIYTFDEPAFMKDCNDVPIENWETLLDKKSDTEQLESAKKNVDENDLATIIYTSGTTGIPKGVMLSHKNITSNIKAMSDTIPLDNGDIALSYLPLCHGFERTFVYCYIYKSIEVHYALNQLTIGNSLLEVRPHIITAVPRVLEKVYENIFSSLQKTGILKRSLFLWSEKLTHQFDFNKKYGILDKLKLLAADKFIFSKIRNKLGGRIKVIGIGASACPEKILKYFCAAGIPIREGYGLTETSAIMSVNHIEPHKAMLGTVGLLLPGFKIKIEEDKNIYNAGEGEILVKGESVTKGYYEDPVNTAESFNNEGWFLTGDIGTIVKNKFGNEFIKLTNRKKELMKSSNGKYIAPVAIENRLSENFYISQVMVVGEQREYVSALIVPDIGALKDWLSKSKIDFKKDCDIMILREVKDKFQKIIDETNRHLSKPEQVRRFTLIPQSWSVETGELTPTLKLKRNIIEKIYTSEIERLYDL